MSRRAADESIKRGEVTINSQTATLGTPVSHEDSVALLGQPLELRQLHYIAFHKPVGYICTRSRQGNSKTIYDLLPPELHQLKSIGRLDKDSSGLLVLTNDGTLAQKLSHPTNQKTKHYQINLSRTLTISDKQKIESGILLEDGISKFTLTGQGHNWTATLIEGRNRQIRRTFSSLGYTVTRLHRTSFGNLELSHLPSGQFQDIQPGDMA